MSRLRWPPRSDDEYFAEAVETEAVWHLLPSLGVDGGRGYWLGAPS